MRQLARRVVPRRWRPALRRLYWRGGSHHCPVCEARVRRLLPEGYDLPVLRELDVVGGEHWPARTCPVCFATTRTRLLWHWLHHESGVFEDATQILHVAPEIGVAWNLATAPSVDYQPADLHPENHVAVEDVERADLTRLRWPDASFDLVIANHVLEHVDDDARALSEIHRVLRHGGQAVLQVPLAHKLEATREDRDATTPEARERAHGQHDHKRLYGLDYTSRLERAGFQVELYDAQRRDAGAGAGTWLLNERERLPIATRTAIQGATPRP